MPSPSKLIAPLKDAVKRHKGSGDQPTGSLSAPPAQEPCVARDYVTIPPPSQEAPEGNPVTQPVPTATNDKVDPSAVLRNQTQASGEAVHPLDVQSDLASAYTAKYTDIIETGSEDNEGEQELTDAQLRRLYDDEEIERFLTVFSKLVTEVTLAPSVVSGSNKKTAVLRSNGQGGQGLEVDVYDAEDSDTETDVDEPWTHFNSSDGQSTIDKPPTTTPGRSSFVETQPQLHQSPAPTYLSARIAAWIIPRLPHTPMSPPHRFKISTFRLAGQRIYLGTYPFYTPFLADLARLAAWSDWNRSARVCTVWWIFWYFNLLLPALFGKILVSLMRRRVMPHPSLKALRERRRLARGAEEVGDAVEGHGAAASFFGTRGVPGMGQGGGDMGVRDILKLTRTIIRGKSKKEKERLKDAGSRAAAQMGLSSEEGEGDPLQRQLDEEDWRTSALKIMEDIADFHERVRNLWLWRREQSSRIYALVLTMIFLFITFAPAQTLAKTTYAVIGVFYWFIIPVLLAIPPEARKRIPPPLFDIPTDAEYAMSLMNIRVAKGESIVPNSLRGSREHGRARRFIANINPDPAATPATPHKGVEAGISSPDQDVGSMRQEAEEKEAIANRERAAAAGVETTESEVPPTAGPPAEVGTLARIKNSIEASTVDLLGNGNDDSTESLQGIGAPQTVAANHRATPGMLNLNSEGISFTPLLKSKPRMQIPLERIQGVKKTSRTSGLRVRHLTEEGIEQEDVFRFVPNRDEIFGKLVGWGGKRWKKVP
ncbi:unnamed protein product [Rhizoctonia solani]|uniref:Uncharacterized protein n=1 Tax=Rhizoctonia solani TaxID=456999 RepID=A0A8H2WSJ8_9AGAM|nr:unnamed protein product [Rhizoctonia solani]